MLGKVLEAQQQSNPVIKRRINCDLSQCASMHEKYLAVQKHYSGKQAEQRRAYKIGLLSRHHLRPTVVDFPLYSDQDVGFGCSLIQDRLQDTGVDDDVDTDEETYDLALKECSANFLQTKQYLPQSQIARTKSIVNNVKNYFIEERVKHPDCFTRNGHEKTVIN